MFSFTERFRGLEVLSVSRPESMTKSRYFATAVYGNSAIYLCFFVNSTTFALQFYRGYVEEVRKYNQMVPASVVHCLLGRNYAVYPLACGEWCDYCAFPSVPGRTWTYRGTAGDYSLFGFFCFPLPYFMPCSRICLLRFVVRTCCACHRTHQMWQVLRRHQSARSSLSSLKPKALNAVWRK